MAVHAAERLPVTIQGVSYLVDADGYKRTTVPVLREQRDQSGEAGEQSLNTQQWLRSQTDWSYGAGQTILDNPDSDRRRFSSSTGIDPWTKGQVSLLPVCESKNNAKTWTTAIMRRVGSYVYVAVGTDLFYSANVTAADGSVVWTQVTALTGPETITDFASDGTTIFIAYGAARAMTTCTVGSTAVPVTFGALTPDWVKVVGGRLIAGDANRIIEVDASGVSTGLDSTATHAGEIWVSACVGPTGVYAASNTDTGIVHFLAVNPADGLLTEPQQVAELPRGETINDMTSYGGFVVLATSAGLRLAAVSSSSSLTIGPVIDSPGAALSLAVDGKFVWWGTAAGRVWRGDLSTFTETLVPAYASDLVSVGDGHGLGNVTDIIRVSDTTVFVDDGNGVQGEESGGVRVPSGSLTVGEVRWNSMFPKVLRTVEVRSSPAVVATGNEQYNSSTVYDTSASFFDGVSGTVAGTITAQFTTDNALTSDVLTLPNKTSVVVTPVLNSSTFGLTFTLTRDAATTTAGPFLEAWMIQAFPSPLRIDEIIVPVVAASRVASSRGAGAAVQQNPQAMYDALRSLMVAKTVCVFEEGSRSENVVVDQMSMAVSKLSDDGDWWEGVITLRLLTVP